MNTENVKEKIERIKILSTLFLKDNIKVFIKDIYHSYYFGNIVLINDDSIIIKCFSPPNRSGKEFTIYWANILDLKKYEELK